MGLSISWIAANEAQIDAVLDALGLAASGESVRSSPVPPRAKLAMFKLDGWVFVVSPDCEFASRERVAAASRGGAAIGAYLEEHVMVSGAFGATDGRLVWSVQHDPEHGVEHLDIWGEPPPALPEIRARLLAQQEADTEDEVDFVFDAPTDLAATVCGFNPNQFDADVEMTSLRVARPELMKRRAQTPSGSHEIAAGEAVEKPKRGLFARLFGGR